MTEDMLNNLAIYSWVVMPILSFWGAGLILIYPEWRSDIRKRALAILLFGSGLVSILKYINIFDSGIVGHKCITMLLASSILPLFLNYTSTLYFNRFLSLKQWVTYFIPLGFISLAVVVFVLSNPEVRAISIVDISSAWILLGLKLTASLIAIYWYIKYRSALYSNFPQLLFLLLFSLGNWTIELFTHQITESNLRIWRGILSLVINVPFILHGLILVREEKREEKIKEFMEMEDREEKDLEVYKQRIFLKLKDGVDDLLNKEEIWRDPEITLVEMAKRLDTNRTYLTEVVNRYYECNFRTLINKYRLTEAARLLASKPQYTIAAIAEEVGFSSISTFNTLFKEKENMTPSQYRDMHIEKS